ncbi:MAG: hypothetical protein JSR85_04665 [Proteobacteria bacterium]|nr:hypothetical protein [Pseudomonadota bacterium]
MNNIKSMGLFFSISILSIAYTNPTCAMWSDWSEEDHQKIAVACNGLHNSIIQFGKADDELEEAIKKNQAANEKLNQGIRELAEERKRLEVLLKQPGFHEKLKAAIQKKREQNS